MPRARPRPSRARGGLGWHDRAGAAPHPPPAPQVGLSGLPVAAGRPGTPETTSSEAVGRLRAAVLAHRPADPREEAATARLLAELARLEQPLDRDADPTHVTASAVVFGPRGVVLHRHRRLGRWIQPGGHLDRGESPEEAVLREVFEETGLTASHPAGQPRLVHVDVHEAPGGHLHLDLRYLLEGGDAEPSPAAGESPDVAWFTWDEAAALADEALAGALRAADAIVRGPGTDP